MNVLRIPPQRHTILHIGNFRKFIGFWCPSIRDQRPLFKNPGPRCSPTPHFPTCIWNKMFLLLPKQKWYPERNYRALQPEAKLNGDTVHFFTSRQHWTACSPRKSLHGGGSAISCIWTFFLTLPLLEHHSCLKISLPPLLWKQEHKCSFGKCIRMPLFPPPSHRAK